MLLWEPVWIFPFVAHSVFAFSGIFIVCVWKYLAYLWNKPEMKMEICFKKFQKCFPFKWRIQHHINGPTYLWERSERHAPPQHCINTLHKRTSLADRRCKLRKLKTTWMTVWMTVCKGLPRADLTARWLTTDTGSNPANATDSHPRPPASCTQRPLFPTPKGFKLPPRPLPLMHN